MFKQHLEEMADRLLADGLVAPDQKDAVIQSLRACWTDQMALIWTVEDVLDECPRLTRDQARDVLWQVCHAAGADTGVRWDTIRDVAVRNYGDVARQRDDDEEDDPDDC